MIDDDDDPDCRGGVFVGLFWVLLGWVVVAVVAYSFFQWWAR